MLDVFDDHDGAIDQQADRDRKSPKRHDVGGPAEQPHDDKRRKHGQRQRGGHHDRGTQIAEKQQQQDHHQQRGLDQDLLHGPHRFFDQVVAVVEDRDPGPLRQYLFNFRQSFLDAADDSLGVGAAQSQYRGPDRLGLAIHRNRAVARQ